MVRKLRHNGNSMDSALHCDDRKHPMCAIQFEGGVQLRITSRERSILPTRPFIHNAVFRVGYMNFCVSYCLIRVSYVTCIILILFGQSTKPVRCSRLSWLLGPRKCLAILPRFRLTIWKFQKLQTFCVGTDQTKRKEKKY